MSVVRFKMSLVDFDLACQAPSRRGPARYSTAVAVVLKPPGRLRLLLVRPAIQLFGAPRQGG
jgi:hypothetical protein